MADHQVRTGDGLGHRDIDTVFAQPRDQGIEPFDAPFRPVPSLGVLERQMGVDALDYDAWQGDDAAKAWLEGIKANNPTDYPNNTGIVDAVGRGEVEVGFVNHYYLLRFLAEQGEGFGARNHFPSGDIGGLMNVAGVGIIAQGDTDVAEELVDYLLQATAQTYFAQETGEYPLIDGVASRDGIPTLAELNVPDVDLSNLDDLRGTLDLMRDAGVLP